MLATQFVPFVLRDSFQGVPRQPETRYGRFILGRGPRIDVPKIVERLLLEKLCLTKVCAPSQYMCILNSIIRVQILFEHLSQNVISYVTHTL